MLYSRIAMTWNCVFVNYHKMILVGTVLGDKVFIWIETCTVITPNSLAAICEYCLQEPIIYCHIWK